LQGLDASGLGKRDIFSDLVSQLTSVENYALNVTTQVVQSAEQQAYATIQAALGNVTNAVNGGIAAANAAVAQINSTMQEISATANAVVTNATQELAALQATALANIANYINMMTQYGNGTLNCVYNYRDTIMSVIGTAGKF